MVSLDSMVVDTIEGKVGRVSSVDKVDATKYLPCEVRVRVDWEDGTSTYHDGSKLENNAKRKEGIYVDVSKNDLKDRIIECAKVLNGLKNGFGEKVSLSCYCGTENAVTIDARCYDGEESVDKMAIVITSDGKALEWKELLKL